MTDDIGRFSGVLWGFLSTCFNGAATEPFGLADDLGGVNAWWVVIQATRESRNTRLAQTRRAVRNPPPIKDIAHIAQAAGSFDAIHKAYGDAGGTIQGGQWGKMGLLWPMPGGLGSSFNDEWRCHSHTPGSVTCSQARQTTPTARMVSRSPAVG